MKYRIAGNFRVKFRGQNSSHEMYAYAHARFHVRLASESAEEEETPGSFRAATIFRRLRARLALSLPRRLDNRPESVINWRQRSKKEASRFRKRGGKGGTIIQRDAKQMISLIQTAYRSCNDVLALQKMSLATFHIELELHSMCMSRLHVKLNAAYYILHGTCLLLRTLYTSHVHYAVGSLPQCHAFS